jgi:hypothetical protein
LRFLRFYFLGAQALAVLNQKHLLPMLLLHLQLLTQLLKHLPLLLLSQQQHKRNLLILLLHKHKLQLLIQRMILLLRKHKPQLLILLLLKPQRTSKLFKIKKPGNLIFLVFFYLLPKTLFPHQYEYFLSH